MKLLLLLVLLQLIGFIAWMVSMMVLRIHIRFLFLAILMSVFSILGLALIFLALRQNVTGMLKVFLMLAGASPAAMFVSIILHNGVSALATKLLGREFEEAVFFLIAVFGCPASLAVGTVGCLVMIVRGMITAR